jgi:GH24 family phage-related lysozyme (muramidase)
MDYKLSISNRLLQLKVFLKEAGLSKDAELGMQTINMYDESMSDEAAKRYAYKLIEDLRMQQQQADSGGEALDSAFQAAEQQVAAEQAQDAASTENKDPLEPIRTGMIEIKLGDSDSAEEKAVSSVQRLLEKHGYLASGSYTVGSFDEVVKNAVIQFQQNNQLEPTGIVEKKTVITMESIAAVPASSASAASPVATQTSPAEPTPKTPSVGKASGVGSASSMKASDSIMKELAGSEGYRGTVYDDSRRDPDGTSGFKISSWDELKGHPTIGYGHLIRKRERPKFAKYLKGKSVMSQAEAWELYEKDVEKHDKWKKHVKVPITQSMFDAMLSFAFNTGPSKSGPVGKILTPLNERDYAAASEAIRNGPKTSSGKHHKGLAKRRNREADMFLADGIPYAGPTPGVDAPQGSMSSMSSLNHKLYALNKYLNKNGFTQEGTFLERILKTASDTKADSTIADAAQITMPIDPDATIPEQTRVSRRRFPSEEVLKRNGIEIIKYIAGTEAEARGEGVRTAEGNVYEVLYDGGRAIAKVVTSSNMEPDIWKKILNLEVPEEQKKHLPKIHRIVEDMFDTVIIMEVLEPFEGHMDSVLRTKKNRESADLFKNEDFIHDAISRSFHSAIETLRDTSKDEEEEDMYRSFVTEQEGIKRELERAILVRQIQPDGAADFVKDKLLNISSLFMLGESDFISQIADEIQNNISSYFEASERPIPKYYSTEGVDESIKVLQDRLQDNPRGYSASRNRRRLEALEREREQAIYTESPEGFLFSEKYMPETESLFALLQTLKDNGINWSDVHAKNLMQRPGSREPVIIDVGLYELPR